MALIKNYPNDDAGKQALSKDRLVQHLNNVVVSMKNFSETTKRLYWQDDTSAGGFDPATKMGSLGADAGELVSVLQKVDDHLTAIDPTYTAKKPEYFGISLTVNPDATVSIAPALKQADLLVVK